LVTFPLFSLFLHKQPAPHFPPRPDPYDLFLRQWPPCLSPTENACRPSSLPSSLHPLPQCPHYLRLIFDLPFGKPRCGGVQDGSFSVPSFARLHRLCSGDLEFACPLRFLPLCMSGQHTTNLPAKRPRQWPLCYLRRVLLFFPPIDPHNNK